MAAFDLERISLGGPVFDLEKLTWLNGRYLRRLSTPDLIGRLRGHLLSDAYLGQVIPLCRERVDTLEGFFDYASFFFVGEVAYDEAALARDGAEGPHGGRGREGAPGAPRAVHRSAARVDGERREAALKAFAESEGWPAKELYMTVRLAVTGRAATPPLFETLAVLGKEVCRRRLRAAAEALRAVKAAPPAAKEATHERP